MSDHRLLLLALSALLAGLSSDADKPAEGQLVIGVQSEDFRGLVQSVHIVASVDGKVSSDETVRIGAPSALPKEIALKGAPGARVEVTVEATTTRAPPPGTTSNVVIARRALTRLVPNGKKLLRVQLDNRCVTFGTSVAGPLGPTCKAPKTCLLGRCVEAEVPFDQLEDYEATWPSAPPDFCRPAKHGAPELFLGTGQTDFAPLADGQTLQLERGPQGGHHIWVAARMKNLRQSGSRTTLNAKLVDDATWRILPAGYVFTFDRDEGNYCKLWGLRFQLDSGSANLAGDYKRFLGKKLEVTVEVIDSTNAKATSTRVVQIADKLLCPDGTTNCNK